MKKLVGYAVAAFFLLAAAPLLLRAAGIAFIPSQGWLNSMALPGSIFGVILGVVGAIYVFRSRASNPQMAHMGGFKAGLVSFGILLLCWVIGYTFVVASLPMVHAGVLGAETQLPYTVEDPDDFGSRGCRPAIELRDMRFLFDELCGPSDVLVNLLSEGDTVYAVGRGTSLGVFYDGFSLP